MKILLISDIHWGFSHNTARIWTKYVRKIADFDVLVIAGDLASHRPEQFARGLRFFRAFAGDKPILMVRGNHDLWGGSRGLEDEHDAALLASGVRSLDDSRIGASLASTLLFCNPDESPCAVDRISLSGSTVAMGSKRGPVVVDDVLFCGFDGWYAKEPTPNDSMRINYQTLGFSSFAEFSQYLNRRADNQLYEQADAV